MDATVVLIAVGSLLGGLVAGVGALYLYRQTLDKRTRDAALIEADRLVNKAKSQAARIERESKNRAKDFEGRARRNVENDIKKQKQKLQNLEQQMKSKEGRLEGEYRKKEETLSQKTGDLDERQDKISVAEEQIKNMEKQANNNIQELRDKLESVANMSSEQALSELKKALEDKARDEAAARMSHIEESAKKEAEEKARTVFAKALARFASEVATERTVCIVPLTSDEMKGKIIGREGRNIRSMEAACGVDLIIDETPEAVVVSSFDPVRREVAKQALEKLMEDGRVHPARIEEVVTKVKADLFEAIKEEAEKAIFDLGLASLHPNILNVLGSLKYRQTATQNLLKHSLEVAYICGLLAAEIGADVKLARRVGLLHDIGKGIDHTVEGSSADVGADLLKKNGEKSVVVDAIRSLAPGQEPKSVMGHLLQAANSFSETRPGTKRSMMENFIRRLGDLESIGNSFDGVQRTFAIQSGKEIRVLVDSGKITDDQSVMLSRDIARKIERELNYPGQIRVNVVRETRIVEHAR